jgi:antitoxin (DNA-binding transcriptional repressor) of toxin-antitoxin stability system
MRRKSYGTENARAHLPELLELAHRGTATVITRHGKPYAILAPIDQEKSRKRSVSLLALRGSGAGLWGDDPAATVASLRDEWA